MDRIIACYNYCYLTLGVQCFFILFFLNVQDLDFRDKPEAYWKNDRLCMKQYP